MKIKRHALVALSVFLSLVLYQAAVASQAAEQEAVNVANA